MVQVRQAVRAEECRRSSKLHGSLQPIDAFGVRDVAPFGPFGLGAVVGVAFQLVAFRRVLRM
ncbi:MAG: hypothetical protein ACKVRO_19765 [Micropepsaceae bacterium]